MLAVSDAPAMQHWLLHGGDQKAPVGTDGGAEVRALPFEEFRGGRRRVRKPERSAVVMGDGKPETLGQESKCADGGGCLKLAQRLSLHERRLAGGPSDRPIRSERDVIDPAAFRVGGDRADFTCGAGRHDFAVVAAADDAFVVCCRGEDRRAGDERTRAVDDGNSIGAGVGHELLMRHCRMGSGQSILLNAAWMRGSSPRMTKSLATIKRYSFQSPAGFYPPADCGR